MFSRRLAWVVIAFAVLGCRSEDKAPPKVRATAATVPTDPVRVLPEDPYVGARLDMVTRTVEARGITDPHVLTAMRLTPRHVFVPPDLRNEAYADRPLPIGFGLTVSQPFIVAAMTEAARVKPGDTVLEIGTGSGYQAAMLAMMGAKVYTIEIHEELGARTQQVLQRAGFRDVNMKIADGWYGWPDATPFDAILVTCATPVVPDRLLAQLKVGGRMVVPLGELEQTLAVIEKTAAGIERTELMDVRFGPMTGVVEAER